jgi:hypothetical protein
VPISGISASVAQINGIRAFHYPKKLYNFVFLFVLVYKYSSVFYPLIRHVVNTLYLPFHSNFLNKPIVLILHWITQFTPISYMTFIKRFIKRNLQFFIFLFFIVIRLPLYKYLVFLSLVLVSISGPPT